MTSHWVRIDANYFANPKVLRAGPDAALMHLAAICYLASHGQTDGVLPGEAVEYLAKLVHVSRPGHITERLVKQSLWHEHDGDYLVHDYAAMNGDRSEAYLARARQQRLRARRRDEEE